LPQENTNKSVRFSDLGELDYKVCWDYQEKLFDSIVKKKLANRDLAEEERSVTDNHLLFVEHPHVYTLGKSGKDSHLLVSEDQLKSRAASFYRINRGGDITYHGPGQLVVYPILDLDNFFTDIHKYLRLLEECVIRILAEHGISAGRRSGETGVWLDPDHPAKARKICAMGVRCSRWVTMHGLAFNVNTDLDYFGNIIPCGIADKAVTSLHRELGRHVDMPDIKRSFLAHFSELFGAALLPAEPIAELSLSSRPG
jgi:lipoyl(octanoyl) transferase